jgi:hypothetical protein
VAGCATPIGFAGHAPTSATANSELTFHPDHSMGADHFHQALGKERQPAGDK